MSNVKISTFSPYNDGSVGSFHFSGGLLNAVLTDGITAIGTDSYTLEMWVYHTSITGQQTYASDSFGSSNGVYFYKNSSHQLSTYYTTTIATSSTTIGANRWYHVAVVRNGTALKQYINGIEAGTATDSTNLTETAFSIGDSSGTSSAEMIGYITDVRLVVGNSSAAIYTSAFTPPTTALTNVSGTGYSTYVLMQPGKNEDIVTNIAAPEEIKYNAFSIKGTDATFSNDNTTVAYGSSGTITTSSAPLPMSSGKWYWEMIVSASSATPTTALIGIQNSLTPVANYPGYNSTNSVGFYLGNGTVYYNAVYNSSYGSAVAVDQVVGVAYDADNGAIYFRDSSTWLNSGDPTSGASATGAAVSGLTGTWYVSHGDGSGGSTHTADYNFGNNGTFNGNLTAGGNTDADGKGDFYYTVPDGYKALTKLEPTQRSGLNRAALNPEKHFGIFTYTGAGSSTQQKPHGFSFTPDFLWIKNRSSSSGTHWLYDTVRGFTSFDLTTGRGLTTSSTAAEGGDVTLGPIIDDKSEGVVAPYDLRTHITIRDGNSAGIDTYNNNYPGHNYVVWGWKAGGDPVPNTDGTITSMVSANKDAGFSIVKFNAGAAGNQTVGHGLTKKPDMIFFKGLDSASGWFVYHNGLTDDSKYLYLHDTFSESALTQNSRTWGGRYFDSKVISYESDYTATANENYISYCWHSVPGFSKFGSYVGNGSADGPFVYTGFRPAWVMVKSSSAVSSWTIYDTVRDTDNPEEKVLYANASDSESTAGLDLDIVSNGFKFREAGGQGNDNGSPTYIYAAFAEAPSAFTNAR